MPIDWAPFVEFVHRHQRFLLTTHIRPDADGLGSMLALAEALECRGKQVQMVVASVFPPRYRFLDPDSHIDRFEPPGEPWRDNDAVVVLDTGTWNQLGIFGPFLQALPAAKMIIDHHLTQDDLGAARLVDTSAEATGRLVHEAITALGEPLSPTMAGNLFVAVAMDTGWFRHSNTTPATFALASRLVEAGASPEHLYEELFERNTLPRLRLTGLVLERMQVTDDGRVVFTEIFEDFPDNVSVVTSELTEQNGRTLMTVTVDYGSKEVRDIVMSTGMAHGAGISYDRLEDLLATLQRR